MKRTDPLDEYLLWNSPTDYGAVTRCPIPPRGQNKAQLITALLGDATLVVDDVE